MSCKLLVDTQIEVGSITANPDDWVTVSCAAGRVILAASAYIGGSGSGVGKWPVAVVLASGALTSSVNIETAGAGTGHGTTIYYYLTTARVVDLA